jgi:flagellar protein FlgJ
MDTKGPNASTDLTQRFALDVQGFDSMRAQAAASPQQSLQTVAKQFDAVFLQMMLKSMREATPQDGPMDSRDEAQFTSMLDEQMAQQMSSKGVGVADALIRQLSRNAGLPSALPVGSAGGAASAGGAEGMLRALSGSQDGGSGDAGSTAMMSALARAYSNKTANGALANDRGYSAASAYTPPTRGNGTSSDVDAFVEKMAAPAQTASDATGIPARFIIGQAALESGWGHGEIRYPNGAPSHNVFGIKATKDWTGKTVASVTNRAGPGGSSAESFLNEW